jgi:hypothetical protein
MPATYYAAIDTNENGGGAVYGVGRTEESARRDALRSLRPFERDEATYRIVPCSRGAYRYVREHGGAPSQELTVSRRGVELREEEEQRDDALLIRLTASERVALTEGARRAGMGLGPWLRSLGLAAARRP